MYLQHGGHYGPTMFACLTMIAECDRAVFPTGATACSHAGRSGCARGRGPAGPDRSHSGHTI